MSGFIQTEAVSLRYRAAMTDLTRKRLLITNFYSSEQESDLSEPPNCKGFGRIRHFRRTTSQGWPPNPLPIDPACKALSLLPTDMLRAQVFQNAACNWRCWYCFVPFNLLAANRRYSDWLSASTLVYLYLNQPDPPPMIDLTGGEPSLVPEWVPWIMTELRNRGLEREMYLWSDDNLSNDFFWRFLSDTDRELVATYRNYGRVCCFKGFNAESFSFNTSAEPALFERQFDLMAQLLKTGIDLYAYVTLSAPSRVKIEEDMSRFVDRLQKLDENLPLRTIPLEVQVFTPVKARLKEITEEALKNQEFAIEQWQKELENRYSSKDRSRNITAVALGKRG